MFNVETYHIYYIPYSYILFIILKYYIILHYLVNVKIELTQKSNSQLYLGIGEETTLSGYLFFS